MAGQGTVTIKVLGDVANVKRAFDEVKGGIGDVESKAQGMGSRLQSVGAKLTAGVTLPIVGMFGAATAAAADENEKMEVLANLLRNTTGATQDQIDANEQWITSMQNATGVADDDLRVAMGKLLVAGRSVEQSHKDLAVAADIAAARHIPLETVVNAMAKAAQGSTGALQKLGVATKDASGEALSYDQILEQASKTMGGSAAASANTAAGRMEILKLKMADAAEAIGSALLPVISKLTEWIGKLAEWFNGLSPQMQQVVVIVGLLAAAIGPVVGVVGSLATAIGFIISPVGLVILAIAALAAGLIYAYTHFEGFRNVVDNVASWLQDTAWPIMQTVFEGIVAAAQAVIAFVQDNWPTVQAVIETVFGACQTAWDNVLHPVLDAVISTVESVVGFVQEHWDQIRAAFQVVFDAVALYWNNVVVPFYEGLKQYIQAVVDAVSLIFAALQVAFQTVWDIASDAWNEIGAPLFETIKNVVGLQIAAVQTVIDTLRGAFEAIWNVAKTAWDTVGAPLFDGIKSVFDAIWTIVEKIADAVGLIISAKDTLSDLLPGAGGGEVPRDKKHGITSYDNGGLVPGPRGKAQLAIVHGGEFVVPADAVGRAARGVTINFYGPVYDQEGAKRAVRDALALAV